MGNLLYCVYKILWRGTRKPKQNRNVLERIVKSKRKGAKGMFYDGFTTYEGNAAMWKVTHDQGTTFVHATSEAVALQRFMAKYPNRSVKKIERM